MNREGWSMADSEVAVIGGGIAGASAAYHLAEHGRSVVLLERSEIASEASGVNAGGIGALGWGHIPNLESYLTTGSLQIFRSFQIEKGFDIEFRASGALQAIQTPQQYEYARDYVLTMKSRGYTLECLTTMEARSIEPELSPELLGAVHLPLRGQADPQKATRAFATAAERLGAQILTGREVTGITRQHGGPFRIACSGGELTARQIVLAAGAWSGPVGEMLGLRIPIVPVRGQMWATRPLPPSVFHSLSSVESSLDWSSSPVGASDLPPELTHHGDRRITRHLYGRQTRDGEIIFGGDRQAVGYDKSVDAAGTEVNLGQATEVLPFLNGHSISRSWAGLMPFSLDGRPIIGKIPQLDDLYIVSGLASSGFGRGPMAGKLISDYVHTGHRPHVLAESDPARCVTALE